MKLMVDIGNSSLKWAMLKEGKLGPQQRIFHQAGKLNAELKQQWGTLLFPTEIWVANVAGSEQLEILIQWIKELWAIEPQEVTTSSQQAGVTNGYQVPQQLGVDRWLALIAAHHLERGTKCIVDCGTAITLDVLTAEGQHLGGLILPGPVTMQSALRENTYALSTFTPTLQEEQITLLARETHSGIIWGTMYAVVGWIEYIVRKIASIEILIMTGGGTPALLPLIQMPHHYIPNLVIQGLAVVTHESL